MNPRQFFGVLFLGGFLYACTRSKKPPSTEPTMPTPLLPGRLNVWSHEHSFIPLLKTASDRIFKASGVRVAVNEPGTITASVPIFHTDDLCGSELDSIGFYVKTHRAERGYIMIGRKCTDETVLEKVFTHELIHALGALNHLEAPEEGLMLGNGGEGKITAADLTLLCSVRECTLFQPEV